MAGAGTGSVPCWHTTVPLPTLSGDAEPAIDVERLASSRGADDVDDGVDGTDFVKMHALNGDGMDGGFGFAEQLKGADGAVFGGVGDGGGANDFEDCG